MTTSEAAAKVSSATLKAAIRAKFGASGYQVFFEVGNDTGARVRRHADAVSIGIWPSTGHAVHGFEIKVSRGDWLKEKAAPEKSLPIFRYCHRWSLVTPQGLVKPDELPPGWGLYDYPTQQTNLLGERAANPRLREVVMPKLMTPEPMSAGFCAAIVRCSGADSEVIAEAVNRERLQWNAARDTEIDRIVEQRVRQHGAEKPRAVDRLKEFEEALGEPLNPYELKELAAAIKAVRKSGAVAAYSGLTSIMKSLDAARSKIDAALKESGFEQERETLL